MMDSSQEMPVIYSPPPQSYLSERKSPRSLAAMRDRQSGKIREFREALAVAGLHTLDKQAAVLALSRSTTWNLLKGKHKGSGVSPTVINRMLASPRLPSPVRAKILEYVAEKAAGCYGDSRARLDKFAARLSGTALDQAWAAGVERRKGLAKLSGDDRATRHAPEIQQQPWAAPHDS
jgi:hypothetical protein